jgi:hypothetical protein
MTRRVVMIAGLAAGVLVLAAAAGLAGCSAAPPAPHPVPAAATCDWYTPTTEGGQQVVVAVTGPACRTHALIAWIADKSGKPWAATRLVVGTEFAWAASGGTVVRIYEAGSALATQSTGGFLTDDFAADGWTVEPPGFPV